MNYFPPYKISPTNTTLQASRYSITIFIPQFISIKEPLKVEAYCLLLYECKKKQEWDVHGVIIIINPKFEAVKIVVIRKTSCQPLSVQKPCSINF